MVPSSYGLPPLQESENNIIKMQSENQIPEKAHEIQKNDKTEK